MYSVIRLWALSGHTHQLQTITLYRNLPRDKYLTQPLNLLTTLYLDIENFVTKSKQKSKNLFLIFSHSQTHKNALLESLMNFESMRKNDFAFFCFLFSEFGKSLQKLANCYAGDNLRVSVFWSETCSIATFFPLFFFRYRFFRRWDVPTEFCSAGELFRWNFVPPEICSSVIFCLGS